MQALRAFKSRQVRSRQLTLNARKMPPLTPQSPNPKNTVVTVGDVEKFGLLLSNITETLESSAEQALTLASENLNWLLERNLPALATQLLQDVPELREDENMMHSYIFLMDFLEAVVKETSDMTSRNQNTMKQLLEAAQSGGESLDACIKANRETFTSPAFLVYLDSEIEAATSQGKNSPARQLLETIRLRLLEEVGATLPSNVAVLPQLLAEEDLDVMQKKTRDFLADFSPSGVDLFLLNLGLMKKDMKKKYNNVDSELLERLSIIENCAQDISRSQSTSNTES